MIENEFKEIFEEMGIDNKLLPVLMDCNRSTIFKYLNNGVDTIPASAVSLIRLLQFIQARAPELLKEWMILNEMNSGREFYLPHPQLYKVLAQGRDKFKPSVRAYLDEHPIEPFIKE